MQNTGDSGERVKESLLVIVHEIYKSLNVSNTSSKRRIYERKTKEQ